MADTYFTVQATFVHLEGSEQWTLTLNDYGDAHNEPDARWLCSGSIDRFTLHDILKVMDTRLEAKLIHHLGLQTVLDFA